MSDVCVLGSFMVDLVAYTPELPKPGQTVHGDSFQQGWGGKGANQAVQAKFLSSNVSFVGRLGDDDFGEKYLGRFKSLGIVCDHVLSSPGAASGVAPIFVDSHGTNQIIIIGGANDLLSEEDAKRARKTIESARVLVVQLEVPLATTLAALRIAREAGVLTIVNPAPAAGNLPDELYQLSDLFVPNETEAALCSGIEIDLKGGGGTALLESAKMAAGKMRKKGAKNVIITLGASGAYLMTEADTGVHVPAASGVRPSSVIDTTGAGDSYIGALAHYLASSSKTLKSTELVSIMRQSAIVAGKSVQKKGTQSSFVKLAELD